MNLINITNNWKRTFFILSLVPIMLLGTIYIVYGEVFDPSFIDNNSITKFLKLGHQHSLFSSDIELPNIVKSIGVLLILTIRLLFLFWIVLFSIGSYSKLYEQMNSKLDSLLELIMICLIYFLFISPESILVYILGCLILILDLVLIIFYWIYQIRTKR